jgi:predicted transcriptional regulator of viral defense system
LWCFLLMERGSESPATRKNILARQESRGRILRIRRGLYAAVPVDVHPDNAQVDPFLIAGKATPDAVLAYHTATELHGKAYSIFHEYQYLTTRVSRPWTFRQMRFRPVLQPKPLRESENQSYGVETMMRGSASVRVTSLERTSVDLLDRLDLAGGFEEAWRFLESTGFLYMDKVVSYVQILRNSTTAAKVGYCLERLRELLAVDESSLKLLEAMSPKQPHYVGKAKTGPNRFSARWNLVLPESYVDMPWREEG